MPETKLTNPDLPTAPLEGKCHALEIRFEVSNDKFDREAFLGVLGRDSQPASQSGFVVCNPSTETFSYHAHLSWSDYEDDQTHLEIGYHPGRWEDLGPEREPYAEGLMSWLGNFFHYDEAQATLSARFSYDVSSRRSRYPLPVKLPQTLFGEEATIDGISLTLASSPKGVTGARLNQVTKKLYILLVGSTRVRFKDYNAHEQVLELSSVALMLTENQQ